MKKLITVLLTAVLLAGTCCLQGFAASEQTVRQKRIVLTFDDGPHPRQTREILDVLDRFGIKATFFVIGVNAQNYPGVVAEVLARGHEIGNHTTKHLHAAKLDEDAFRDEIGRCEAVILEQTGVKCRLFRPPEGAMTDSMRRVIREMGYTNVLWTLDTRDWAHTPPDQISDYIIQNAKNGDIILMHDYIGANSPTVQALETFIPILLERGFTFVTAGELLDLREK